MPEQMISHLICTTALIILIFMMQFSYTYVVDNIWAEMVERELKEIADYVSDTLANLYFLANSTNSDVIIEKTLNFPSDIRGSTYTVEIVVNATGSAQYIHAYLKGKPWISAASWLLPGLSVDKKIHESIIESGGKAVVAGCSRVSMNVYVWIAKEGAQ